MAIQDLEMAWLRSFVAVTQSGSMTDAAKILFRSQSAISMHIKHIETVLQRQVFLREGRSLLMTPIGHELLGYAQTILTTHAAALQALVGSAVAGKISLGIPDDYAPEYLPQVLSLFTEKYPAIELSLICEPSSALIPKIEANELDLAIISRDHDGQGTFLFKEPLLWLGAEAYPVWQKRPLPIAMYEFGSQARKNIIHSLSTLEGEYRIVYSSPYIAGQLAAVKSGMAIAVVTQCSVPPGFLVLNKHHLPELPMLSVAVIESPQGVNAPLVQLLKEDIIVRLQA
ncbi:MAG: LysR family transcriptional regulator [Neisseriaceae bacterium]|nr:LysR family transcriptional regulator [Neisseriaceae bacterium]